MISRAHLGLAHEGQGVGHALAADAAVAEALRSGGQQAQHGRHNATSMSHEEQVPLTRKPCTAQAA